MANKAAEFIAYFNSRVAPCAQTLETKRKNIITAFWIWGAIVLLPVLFFGILFMLPKFDAASLISFFMALLFPLVFLVWVPMNFVRKLYGLSAKKKILPLLLGFWGKYEYIPPVNLISTIYKAFKEKTGIAGVIEEFKKGTGSNISVNSEILARLIYFENLSYDDKIRGKFQDLNIELSELETTYTTRDRENNSTTHTTFKGVVFSAQMNKSFKGITAVAYDSIDKNRLENPGMFGFVYGDKSQKTRFEKVHLEDPEFREGFEVYSNDQIEARYIFTTAFMNRFLKISKAFNGKIKAIFMDNNIYILVDVRKNWFEIPFYKSCADINNYKDFINDFTKLLSILETLKLNENIGM